MLLGTKLSTSLLLFRFSLTNLKFSENVCWLFGFPSVEIKSDDGYQIGRRISSDIHRLILYHVISIIKWDLAENILWVTYIQLFIYLFKGPVQAPTSSAASSPTLLTKTMLITKSTASSPQPNTSDINKTQMTSH